MYTSTIFTYIYLILYILVCTHSQNHYLHVAHAKTIIPIRNFIEKHFLQLHTFIQFPIRALCLDSARAFAKTAHIAFDLFNVFVLVFENAARALLLYTILLVYIVLMARDAYSSKYLSPCRIHGKTF